MVRELGWSNRSQRQVSGGNYKRYSWNGYAHNSNDWTESRSLFLGLKNDMCPSITKGFFLFEIAITKDRYDWNLEGSIYHC